MKSIPYEYVTQYYGVHPVIGSRVTTKDGKKSGVIVRKRSYDQYVHVKFDGSKFDVPVHPMDLEYRDSTETEPAWKTRDIFAWEESQKCPKQEIPE